jgi:hypothetical protein
VQPGEANRHLVEVHHVGWSASGCRSGA